MFDQDRFIEACLAATNEQNPQRAVLELMRKVVGSPGEISAALGEPDAAGMTTLYRSKELTVVNIIWAPKMSIYPHDHGTWAVIGIYGGQEDNSFYRRRKTGPGLDQVNGRSLKEKDAIALGEDAIHAVTNPRESFAGALHVYGGDLFAIKRSEWDSPLAAERPYNFERAMRTFAQADEAAKARLPRRYAAVAY